MKNLAWIALWLLAGCILCSMMGCRTDNSLKLVSDITPSGDVTWHTEYEVKWR